MQNTYSSYPSIKLPIPWKSRVKASGKVLVATCICVSQAMSLLSFLRMMYVLHTMVDPVEFLAHALVFGLTTGYIIRVSRDILRGYVRTRWFDTLVVDEPLLIAERAGHRVKVTECRESEQQDADGRLDSTERTQGGRLSSQEEIIECVLIDGEKEIPVYGPAVASGKPSVTGALRLLISLFGRFRIWLLGSSGKRIELLFNRRRSSLIAFLSSVRKGAAASWAEIKGLFYGALAKASLYQDKSDIQEYVHEMASSASAASAPPALLKKRRGKAGYTALALSPDCAVDAPGHLIFWYRRIEAYWQDRKHFTPPRLKELREGEDYVPSAYGSGFVGQDLEEDLQQPPGNRVWTWAIAPYQEHRTRHLDFLRYAAERELEESRKAVEHTERRACLTRVRDLYSALVVAGSRLYPDVRRCKAALHHLQDISRQLNDTRSAERVERLYQQNLDHWEQLQKESEHMSGEED